MNKIIKSIYTILAFLLVSTPASWGLTSNQSQVLNVIIPTSINITVINPAQAVGTIAVANGYCSNMAAEFKLRSNASQDYSIGMTATAIDGGGTQNSFFQIPAGDFIALANVSNTPPSGAIAAVKMTTPTQSANPDVIAYQLTPYFDPTGNLNLVMTNGAGPNFTGWYYNIYKSSPGAVNGTVKITLNAAPHTNTYSSEYDSAGLYQSVVTVTAYAI